MRPRYRSQIPKNAREVVIEQFDDGAPKITEYYLGKDMVGVRHWDSTEDGGHVCWDIPYRNGKKEGLELSYYFDGRLTLVEPFVAGVIHGTARQYAHDGRLLGTYRLNRGTGVDLWRDGLTGKLVEEWHYIAGAIVLGRFWSGNDRTIWQEYFCRTGFGYHGIFREWNDAGHLRRGFPRYFVNGEKVTKKQYLRACGTDVELPEIRPEDDRPERNLPPEYVAQLKSRRKK